LVNERGTRVIYEAWSDGGGSQESLGVRGEHEAVLTIPPVLPPGEYTVGAWLGTTSEDFFWEDVLTVQVQPTSQDRAEPISRNRAIQLARPWRLTTRASFRA
jgi:hypothetical protein